MDAVPVPIDISPDAPVDVVPVAVNRSRVAFRFGSKFGGLPFDLAVNSGELPFVWQQIVNIWRSVPGSLPINYYRKPLSPCCPVVTV